MHKTTTVDETLPQVADRAVEANGNGQRKAADPELASNSTTTESSKKEDNLMNFGLKSLSEAIRKTNEYYLKKIHALEKAIVDMRKMKATAAAAVDLKTRSQPASAAGSVKLKLIVVNMRLECSHLPDRI